MNRWLSPLSTDEPTPPDWAHLLSFQLIAAKGWHVACCPPLCESIKAQGITHFYLEVLRENSAAIALYRSLGFHLTQGLWGFKGDVRGVHINGELNAATTDELLRAVWSACGAHTLAARSALSAVAALPGLQRRL
jgi:hypothetical protein